MKKRFFYFGSTHWDREWYNPFQVFRGFLAENAESIAETLEKDPEYRFFHFDGQTVVLEDIEEINPGLAERLNRLIRSGRLMAGPWYLMPDELLVSGESLIRNLQRGFRVARLHGGEPWKVGYACDMFGHIAQFPQILNGFGIQTAAVWRGVDIREQAYVIWESPDGSRCNTVHLFHYGGSFASQFRNEKFPDNAEEWLPDLQKFFGNDILLNDGQDHTFICKNTTEKLKKLKEKFPDTEICWTHYHDLPAFKKKNLPVLKGELIATAEKRTALLAHTLSSRYDLKKRNDLLRNRLELEAEPMSVFLGKEWTANLRGMLDLAWKQYLRNQSHDCICGCSVDAVHRDMGGRYADAEEICDFLTSRFIASDRASFTGSSETGPGMDPKGEYTVRIFNPLPFARKGIQEVELAIPRPFPVFTEPGSQEYRDSFRIFQVNGKEVPYSVLSIRRRIYTRLWKNEGDYYDFNRLVLNLDLAPMQWTTLKLRPSETKTVRFFGSLRTGTAQAENSCLKLSFHENGTFDVLDKRNGRLYSGLNSFVIDRETGEGWHHATPDCSSEIVGGGFAQTEVVTDTFNTAVFRITREFRLPESIPLLGDTSIPSEKETLLRIVTEITLTEGSDMLKVHTHIPDMTKDCRIRLRIPTGIPGKYFAGQAFAVMERESGRASGTKTMLYSEPEQLEKNFDRFTGKRDKTGGIAFLPAAGLHEVAGLDDKEGTVLVTMCRTFCRTISYTNEPDGELPGPLDFDYGWFFFGPETGYAELEKRSQFLRTLPVAHLIGKEQICKTPKEKKVLSVQGDLAFSALKVAEDGDGMVLRVVNLSGKKVSGLCIFPQKKKVVPCDLLEEASGQVRECRELKLDLPPWKIGTFRIR